MSPRELVRAIFEHPEPGRTVRVSGWVRTRRTSKGGFSFIELNDGSCFANLQIVAGSGLENYDDDILHLFPGSTITVEGQLVASPGKGQAVEVQAESVRVHGFADPTRYPLGKQRVSFERLREVAHLRPRTNTFGAVARVRNCLAAATHRFFQERDFLYVTTPIITASDCEGAGEQFRVTTLEPGNMPRTADGDVDFARDFFGRQTYLTVSGQLEGEAYACALGNIYTFGPTFRAENSNTRRHLAEFWMVEPEMAFADLADDADLAEAYIRFLCRTLLETCPEDLAFFNKRIDATLIDTLTGIADSDFARVEYSEAIELLREADRAFEYTVEWGADLQSEHERFLAEEVFKGPVVVRNFPAAIKPFYMRVNDDHRTVAAMDVLLPNVGEIIGGSQREDRLERLASRMKQTGLEPAHYDWFLDLRRYGTVPHAGFGLGFERMVQFCTGMANIRDVIPFPRTPNNADF